MQRLGRRKDVDQFYHVKMLILNDSAQAADERHGRMLIHTELSVLSVLRGVRGVVQVRDFFTDVCLVEEVSESGSGHAADDKMQNKKELLVDGRRKTVKELNRVCLVTDCLFPHEFSPESQQFINLQVRPEGNLKLLVYVLLIDTCNKGKSISLNMSHVLSYVTSSPIPSSA